MFINETQKYVNNNTENTDSPCVFGVGVQVREGSGMLQGGLCEERLELIHPDTAIRHLQTHCRAQLSHRWGTSGKVCARKGKINS